MFYMLLSNLTANDYRKAQLLNGIERKSNEECWADWQSVLITRCSALQTSLFKTTVDCGVARSQRWVAFVGTDWEQGSSISWCYIFNSKASLKNTCELVSRYTMRRHGFWIPGKHFKQSTLQTCLLDRHKCALGFLRSSVVIVTYLSSPSCLMRCTQGSYKRRRFNSWLLRRNKSFLFL